MNLPISTKGSAVFVVEDEALIVMELRDRLTHLGYHVCGTAASGEKALISIPASGADLVLMDICLTGQLDGIETAERLREQSDLPVVFLTAFSDSELIGKAKEVAPYGYLVKPFEERELHSTIQMALSKHRLDRQLKEANVRLEEAVRLRTVELEQTNQQLRAEMQQRRQVEETLRKSEERLSLALLASDQGWWDWNVVTGETHVSSKYAEMFGSPTTVIPHGLEYFLSKIHPDDLPVVSATMEAHLQGKTDYSIIEYRAWSNRGEYRWQRGVGRVVARDQNGAPLRMSGVIFDIDERKQSELKLRQFSQAVESASDGILIVDVDAADQPIVYVNRAFSAMTGYSKEEAIGRNCRFLSGSDRNQPGMHTLRVAVQERQACHVILRNYRKTGELLWNDLSIAPIIGPGGHVTHFIGVLHDVTARMQAEDALRRNEAKLRVTLDSISDAVLTSDTEGRISRLNPVAERITGWTASEAQDMQLADVCRLLHKDEERPAVVPLHAILQTGEFYHSKDDFILLARDGTKRPVAHSAAPIRDEEETIMGIVVVLRDVTEERAASQQIAALLKDLKDIKIALDEHSIVSITDASGYITYVNDKFCAVSRYSRAELIGANHRIVKSDKHPADFYAKLWSTISRGGIWHEEICNRDKDGGLYWVDTTIVPFLDETGHPYQYVSIRTDITVRKQAEERISQDLSIRRQAEQVLLRSKEELERLVNSRTAELQKSEELFRQIAMSINHIFWVYLLPDERFLYVSPAYETISGRQIAELDADPKIWFDNIHPDDLTSVQRAYDRWMRELKSDGDVEFRFVRPDGEFRWIRIRGLHFRQSDDGKTMVSGVAEDFTQEKNLEMRALQSQKLQAVGQLAGGIAHDFNNLLLVISAASEKLLTDISEHDPNRTQVASIRDAETRAAALIRQLLAFGRKQVMELSIVDLNLLVVKTEKLIRGIIRKNVVVSLNLAPEPAMVAADPGQIDQVLFNLILNAQDAMPEGGELRIETCREVISASISRGGLDLPPGDYIRLSVVDTGCGMTDEVKTRSFEPYFTTKPVGKGTGLGLSVVHGIVSQCEGQIHIESAVGAGTRIDIRLPRAIDGAMPQAIPHERSPMVADGELILVVDDETQVREIIRAFLETQGYKVLAAAHGKAAILAAHRSSAPIRLILTDVAMPEMTGIELADELNADFPDIPVLFMSGFTSWDEISMRRGNAATDFIPKPFPMIDLLNKVRIILESQKTTRLET